MSQTVDKLTRYFYELVEDRSLSHAYLLTGEDFSGKVEVTDNLIQALVCQSYISGQGPCQECSLCLRAKGGQLADVMYLRVEKNKTSLSVDQVRLMREWLSTSPLEAGVKLVVIEEAELMTSSASNALLTILEEPNDGVYLILYAPSSDHVLDTIKSRSQELYFPLTDINQLKNYLQEKGLKPDHALIVANLAGQDTQRYLENYDKEDFQTWLDSWNYFYQYLLKKDPLAYVVVETHLKINQSITRQGAIDGLDYLALINSQMILALSEVSQADSQILTFINSSRLIDQYKPSLNYLGSINDEIYNCKQKLLSNVTPQLALEQLTIKLCQW